MRKVGMALCMVVGAFIIHCGQSAMNGSTNADGFLKDAMGQMGGTCCPPPGQTFTKLAEGDLTMGSSSSVIPVGAYREVVVYMSKVPSSACSTAPGPNLKVQFRPSSSDAFGTTGQVVFVDDGGRFRVDGPDMQLVLTNAGICTPALSGHYVVAGVQ
jgi:hypothetical protein